MNNVSLGSIPPASFQKAMLLLAEKRTAMTTLRTGIAICVIPLSMLSFLVAMVEKFNLHVDTMTLWIALAGNAVLVGYGLYLIRRGLVRMHFHDRKLNELKAQYPELGELFFQTSSEAQVVRASTRGFTMNYDVVFHFDHDHLALEISFSNIENYMSYLTENKPSVALVVNGPGVKLLLKSGKYAKQFRELSRLGAAIWVCNNALHHFEIDPDQLCPECVVVPAGIVKIVELQNKGFSYVKP